MNQKLAIIVFCAFAFVSLFGLPLLLAHAGHHHDCPLLQGAQLCQSTTLEHVSLWELLLATVLDALVVVFLVCVVAFTVPLNQKFRTRYRYKIIPRPTLFQELYSSGILNRKEPIGYALVH